MKKFFSTITLIMLAGLLFAQQERNIWYFGFGAGLDFNSGAPTVLTNGALNTDEGCSSICDANGDLLFYTDGITIWDRTHAVMLNGTGLTGDPSSTQSGLIVKKPGSANLYYVFTINTDWNYSIVDMSLNNGYGGVTANKNVLIYQGFVSEKQTATYHQNGTDIWVVAHKQNEFHAHLLSPTGLNPTPVVSVVGLVHNNLYGQMKISPQGNRIALGTYAGVIDVSLYDFDKSTGLVSNNIELTNGTTQCYGLEFSPNGRWLYCSMNSGVNTICQYDLSLTNVAAIQASQTTIGNSLAEPGGMQLGPDGKIYCTQYFNIYLGAINSPNQQGVLCDFDSVAINLGAASCGLGLPGMISKFGEGPSAIQEVESDMQLSCYPNPASNQLHLSVSNKYASFDVEICDMAGRLVSKQTYDRSMQVIDISALSEGIYVLSATSETARDVIRFEKVDVSR
jgi:hypothetical protein